MTRRYLALAILLVAPIAARADVILDDFTNPGSGTQFVIASQNSNPYALDPVNLGGGTIRNAVFTVTSPNPAGPFSLLGVVGGGSADMFFDSTSSGNGVISYTFGAPIDFSGIGGAAGAVRLTTQSQATIGNPNVAYSLSVQTASGTFSGSGSFANSAGFIDQDVLFSSLTGSGDLSQVTGLSLTVTGQTADDFRLDKISLTEPTVQQVPAPPAVFLALAALPVLGLRRYLGRKAA